MTNTQETISVGQALDLVPLVPHLLGFTPTESLVVLCFTGKALGPVMRVDLPPPEQADEVAEYLAVQAGRHGNRTTVFAFSARPHARAMLRVLLDRMLVDMPVIDAIVVNGGTASFLPDQSGQLDDPVPVPDDGAGALRMASEAALKGRVVLPDRAAVAASIAPPRAGLLRRARHSMRAAREHLRPIDLRSMSWLGDRLDIALDIALASMQRLRTVPPSCAATMALLAQQPAVRDLMIAAMLGERHREWVPMLINAVGQVPDDESEDLTATLAVMAYRAGDGALAQVAVDRVFATSPEHRLAELMYDIMSVGMPPEQLDDLGAAFVSGSTLPGWTASDQASN